MNAIINVDATGTLALWGAQCQGCSAVYGTKGVASSTNTPGARSQHMMTATANSHYLLGGFKGVTGFNDVWSFDVTTKQWTWLAGTSSDSTIPEVHGGYGASDPSYTPSACYEGAMVTDGTDLWYSAGAAMWKFTISNSQWSWYGKEDATTRTYGTKGVASINNSPGERVAHNMVYYNSLLYLFGGISYTTSTAFNDMWAFNYRDGTWAWLAGSAEPAGGSGWPGVAITKGAYNAANVPGSIHGGTMVVASTGIFYLYGGRGDGIDASSVDAYTQANVDQMWAYNPAMNQWSWLFGSRGAFTDGAPSYPLTSGWSSPLTGSPGPRTYHSMVIDSSDHIWVASGSYGSGSKANDVWVYFPATNQWQWIAGSTAPDMVIGTDLSPNNYFGGRSELQMAIDGYSNIMLMGGYGQSSSLMGDVWAIGNCAAGAYKPISYTASSCTSCQAGRYSQDGATVCNTCGANTYSNAAATACIACPDYSTSPAGSSSSQACNCQAGYGGAHGTTYCYECLAGTYRDASMVAAGTQLCMSCDVGKYSGTYGATSESVCVSCPVNTTSPAGSSSYNACVCKGGTYGTPSTTCTLCPSNSYCQAGSSSPQTCGTNRVSQAGSSDVTSCQCKPGYWGYDGNYWCEACEAGRYCPLGNVNNECPIASYCPAGSSQPVSCGNNRTTSWYGSSKPDQCFCQDGLSGENGANLTCTICEAGSYCSGGASKQCSAPNYCPKGSKEPLWCPGFSSTIVNGSTSVNDCLCKPGSYYNTTRNICIACDYNSYKSTISNEDGCTSCPMNAVTWFTGSTSSDACVCPYPYRGPIGGPCTKDETSSSNTVGIAVGVSLGCVALVGLGIIFVVRRRRNARNKTIAGENSDVRHVELLDPPNVTVHVPGN